MKEDIKLMKGNEAIAHAAIRYGADGYFGYPITPQSEVMETLMEEKPWETTGMVVLQAESEVAAINMVYGGASCGKAVMTSSSSPGVALKQEGISYLAGAELPCLIVNVMRGGGSRNHTTKSSRLFPSREGRRSRRLSFNRISSRFGSRDGRLRGIGIRSRFQIPQPGYYSSRWNYRANDGKSGTSAFPQTPYRRRNKGTKSVGDIRKNQKSEEKCHHLSRTRSGNYGAE